MVILRVVAITFVVSILTLQTSWCEIAYDRQGDPIPPGAEILVGVLDRVTIEQGRIQAIIINDTIYHVDKNTVVKNSNSRLISLTDCEPGTLVEFYELEGLVTKLMPALNTEENSIFDEPVNSLPTITGQSDSVRQEGGVWKN